MLLGFGPGCLLVSHSTQVVRENEKLRPVRFESEQAKIAFEASVHQMQAIKESSDPQLLAIPFLFWVSSTRELSDNAIYNDQAALCDLNGDGLITLQEAINYRARVDAIAQKAKAATSTASESKPASPATVTQKQPDTPPGLIEVANRSASPKFFCRLRGLRVFVLCIFPGPPCEGYRLSRKSAKPKTLRNRRWNYLPSVSLFLIFFPSLLCAFA